MEHTLDFTEQTNATRFGFHYFPDSLHYRSDDLQTWIPELKALGASWLVLQSEANRAIPEEFILGLVKQKIEPIIHFPLNLADPISINQIDLILSSYAKWGVHYVIFFDRPNSRTAWGDRGWGQTNLVERFIDQFLPLAQSAVEYGLIPVFPPLEPGGHYWDTVFLRDALEKMQAREAVKVLEKIAISAYAWTWEKSLNWGFGGQEQWPLSRPYRIPSGSQDERGFRIFDWYHSITRAVLQRTCPVILLQTGITSDPTSINENSESFREENKYILDIIKLLNNENVYDAIEKEQALKPLPEEVLCCNFWLLSSGKNDLYANQAWITEDDQRSTIAQDAINYYNSSNNIELYPDPLMAKDYPLDNNFCVSRYLLFPSIELFLQNGKQKEIQEYIKRYKPTIGFSINEAAHAEVVTIAGFTESFSDAAIESLRKSGCSVNQLSDAQENVFNTYTGEKLGDFPSEKTLEYASV